MDDIGSKSSSSQQSVGLITPVLLSGGAGTRLWPMSRALYPKQLLALFGDTSLLQPKPGPDLSSSHHVARFFSEC